MELSSTTTLPRMRGSVVVDDNSIRDDINPRVRFFVFSAEPDRHQLIAVKGDPPLPAPPVVASPRALIGELFIEILGRIPTGREVQIASGILAPNGKMQPNGVEEFLWSLLVHPEFQYIY